MSRVFDPHRKRRSWEPGPEVCAGEGCDTLLEPGGWGTPGPDPKYCRACQNKNYEAKIAGTAQGARRKRRKSLHSKRRRLEARIERDQADLAAVLLELGADAARGARA